VCVCVLFLALHFFFITLLYLTVELSGIMDFEKDFHQLFI
jgi:hypothetical protein